MSIRPPFEAVSFREMPHHGIDALLIRSSLSDKPVNALAMIPSPSVVRLLWPDGFMVRDFLACESRVNRAMRVNDADDVSAQYSGESLP